MDKAEKTRQFIIEQAAPVFNTRGIAATAMSDVMVATGLSKGSLYVHFKDKEDLALAAVKHNLQLLNDRVALALQPGGDAGAQLSAFLEVFADPLQPPVKGGCPMLNFGMEADDLFPAIRDEVDKSVRMAQRRIAGIIRKGIADGTFVAGWHATEAATKMFAMIEGGIMISRIAGHNGKMKLILKMQKQEIEDHQV